MNLAKSLAVIALTLGISIGLLPGTAAASGTNCSNYLCAHTDGSGLYVRYFKGYKTFGACTGSMSFHFQYVITDNSPSIAPPKTPGGHYMWSYKSPTYSHTFSSLACYYGVNDGKNGPYQYLMRTFPNNSRACVILWHHHSGSPSTSDGYACNTIHS